MRNKSSNNVYMEELFQGKLLYDLQEMLENYFI